MKITDPLKKNKDFNKVFKKGKYYVGKIMVLYVLPNNTDRNKMGVTTVRNFGSSVMRNRQRRLIKENYRLMEDEIKEGFDIVFSARKSSGDVPTFYDVKKEMRYLMRKMGILKEESND